jgi:hypothetical protein
MPGSTPARFHLLLAPALFLVLLTRAAAAPAAATPPPVPDAAGIDAAALNEASRAAVACGADYLLARAATNYMNFAASVAYRRSIRKAYTVHYSKKIVDEPIFAYDYEDVLVATAAESSAGTRKLQKTKRIIPGSARKVGSRKVESLVIDPNGPIVHEYPEENQPEVWQKGFVGQNALVVYTLLACGVPQDHPVLAPMINSLNDIVTTYGYPDMTWDLAWLAAAYCQLNGNAYDEHRAAIVNKLLDGQVVDGPGRGLWGPVCVNMNLFAAMVGCETALARTVEEEKKRLETAPNNRTLMKRAADAQSALDGWTFHYRRITQQGLRFEKITESWKITPPNDPDATVTYGLPYYFYNQAVTDIEDTALALHALRVASEKGYLPAQTWRPDPPRARVVLPPAETAAAVLARCGAALAKLQQPDGRWTEANLHQPLTMFQSLGFRQLDKAKVLDLKSQRTLLSTAQAAAGLFDIGAMVGMDKLAVKFPDNLRKAREAGRAEAAAFLDGKKPDVPVSRYLEPYDYILKLADLSRALDGFTAERQDLAQRLAYRLILLQTMDGSWNEGLKLQYSSGTTAYWQEQLQILHEEEQARLPKEKRKPYDANYMWNRHTGWNQKAVSVEGNVVGTAYAMLFLQESIHSPVAACLKENERAATPALAARLAQLVREKHQWTPGFLAVTPATLRGPARGLPLVLDSRCALTGPALLGHLKDASLLLVEATDTNSTRAAEASLLALYEGAKAGPVTKEMPCVAGFEGPLPELRGVFDAKGAPLALFVPPARPQVAYVALRNALGADFFARSYAMKTGNADHILARSSALGKLVKGPVEPEPAPAPAAPETKPAPEAKPAGTEPAAAAEEPAPAAEPARPAPVKKPAADETW